jgi:DNA-binding CsgD family transcriptional regulator
LTRALAEPPPDSERAAVLHELGRAETAASLPDSLEHLERAYAHADSSGQRGSIAEDLALALMGHMRLEDSVRVLRAAIIDVYASAEGASSDEAQRLGALYVTFCCYLRRGSEARGWLESLGAAPDAATPGGRLLLVAYSHQAITSGESVVSASKLAQDALVGGLLKDVGPASSQIWTAVSTLIIGGSYAAAEVAIADAVAAAQQGGSSYGYAMALCFDGLLAYRRGRLEDAIANERRATEMLAGEHAAGSRHYAVAFLAHALIDVGELQLAAEQLDALPLDDAPPLAPYAFGVAARGRLRLIRGDPEGALFGQRRVETLAGMERLTPPVLPWRSQAALALAALDRRADAVGLAAEEVKLAEASGSAWAHGLALQAAGVVAGGAEGVAMLRQAVQRLQAAGALAEQARALIDLGSATEGVGGSRAEAIGHLREGLDLADRCAAAPLIQRARSELVARGARPRRGRLTGIEALTPMERRIAERAASGSSNRAIAHDLFLSLRTVESHLTGAYRKLQIASRRDLASALRFGFRDESRHG